MSQTICDLHIKESCIKHQFNLTYDKEPQNYYT